MNRFKQSAIVKIYQKIFHIIKIRGVKSLEYLTRYFKEDYRGRFVYRKIIAILNSNRGNKPEIIKNILLKDILLRKRTKGEVLDSLATQFAKAICSKRLNNAAIFDTDQFNKLILTTRPDIMDDSSWFNLKFIAIANGLYEIAFNFRTKGIQFILMRDSYSNSKELIKLFQCALETNNFKYAQELIKRASLKYPDSIRNLELDYALMVGDYKTVHSLTKHIFKPEDSEFAKLILGMRIAIVGPAPGPDIVAEEIDQYDVVIRTNYRGEDKLPDPCEFGRRTDVSYYNAANTGQIFSGQSLKYLDNLKFAVFKKVQDTDRAKQNLKQPHFRTLFSANRLFVTGKAQMISQIIHDLMLFEPQEIKLFKANFLLTDQPYYQTYISPSNQNTTHAKLWLDHAYHDLISQVVFCRNLMDRGLLKVADQTREVLNHSDHDYIVQIEKLYS